MVMRLFRTCRFGDANQREKCCGWVWPAIVVWLGLVIWGWWSISAYAFKRETVETGGGADHWPADTAIDVLADRPALLMFLHPRCPCTAASLAEMERLLVARSYAAHRVPQVIMVATVPDEPSPSWLVTPTTQRARRLPGATFYLDHGGREAERFGATTSGTVMWFDERGRRLYAGGITYARGHEGDNVGRDYLARLLAGARERVEGIPALGCTLCLPRP